MRAASRPTFSQSVQPWIPTIGSVRAAWMALESTMAAQARQRPLQIGTKKNDASQTGLKINSPQTTPPHPGRPRDINTQPQTKISKEKTEFCPSPNDPAKPGKRITPTVATGHQTRPLDKVVRPSPTPKAQTTIMIWTTRYATCGLKRASGQNQNAWTGGYKGPPTASSADSSLSTNQSRS